MDLMHNRAISEEYFILQVQERWTFLLYDKAGAHNGLQDVSDRQSWGPKIKKKFLSSHLATTWEKSSRNFIQKRTQYIKSVKKKISKTFFGH